MSPIRTPEGTQLPSSLVYQALPEAVTSVLQGGTITSTRIPVPGEPASDANHFDTAIATVTAVVDGLLRALMAFGGGVVVHNEDTDQWETWPIYISAIDPKTSANPPLNNDYVWLRLGAGGSGGSGGATVDVAQVAAAVIPLLRAQGATF